jgi:hypothetical protein
MYGRDKTMIYGGYHKVGMGCGYKGDRGSDGL